MKRVLKASDIERLENTSPVAPALEPQLGADVCRLASVCADYWTMATPMCNPNWTLGFDG